MQDVLRMISRLKDTRTPVLISGESGTGKNW
jgi:DNA-binding NtrC family response regulator